MAGFLYYKPGQRQLHQVTLDEVKEWGLGHAFDAAPQSIDVLARAMDGAAGFVFADEKQLAGRSVGLYPAEQTWEKVDGRDDGLWIGWYNDAKPTAEDLKRKQLLNGYWLDLESGRWVVPLERSFDDQACKFESQLPCYLRHGPNGKTIKGRVLQTYAWLWEITESYAASLFNSDETIDDTYVDEFDLACKILSANYRISAIEASVLELFSEIIRPDQVLLLAVDYWSFIKWQDDVEKKSAALTPDGSNSSNGEVD
jgi:hypothetical protein